MEKYIDIKGARVHNLKNIDVQIPRNKFIVVTGLSGSGKSTLAFNTIFAEGQRRYVESLSAYARQFLGRMDKPEADSITGIPPAIAIEQKVNTRNPRSTVGTSTEIYDYMRLLFARIGRTYSPVSGKEVHIETVTDVVNYVSNRPKGERMLMLAPLSNKGKLIENLTLLLEEGFSRLFLLDKKKEETVDIKDFLQNYDKDYSKFKGEVYLLIDRLTASDGEETLSRVADSVQISFARADGHCSLYVYTKDEGNKLEHFSNNFEIDGIHFEKPNEYLFSFNNPLGACPVCEGYGKTVGIDEDLVIPNKGLSVYDDAVACWMGDSMQEYKKQLVLNSTKFDFPIHKPYEDLTEEHKRLLWEGNQYFEGIDGFFKMVESNRYKIQYRVMLARYTGKTTCTECKGSRLRKEAGYVKVGGKNISELVRLSVEDLATFFKNLSLAEYEQNVAGRALIEINTRLVCLLDLGLGYLNLNRLSNTLSGGESQRINLAVSLGSSLVGSLYILDEPSIGLHPRDTHRLIKVLKGLRDIGNTVLIVEHEEEVMRAADEIIDIGPLSGVFGGEVVFQGKIEGSEKELKNTRSLTLKYLHGEEKIETPKVRRKGRGEVTIVGARENNLKNISVSIPLNKIVAITGVSGSGKSTLVKGILYPELTRHINGVGSKGGVHKDITGNVSRIKSVEMIDQNPIGKSSRSNPATYIKVYDDIRKLFADTPYAKHHGFSPSFFSFNIDGGRCEECQGDGFIKVEMQFMADVILKCEHCGGKRFKDDILEVKYKDKNISDILDLSVDEAINFFREQKENVADKIANKLKVLQDVGLGYVKLGQPSNTLSGGESQRVKLAFFLLKEVDEHTLFIFDEPTTGLHFHDIKKLMDSFNALVDRGNSMIIVEHNMDVIKSCDWVIDLGPEGGDKGGSIVFEGTPEDLVKCETSYTAKFLKEHL